LLGIMPRRKERGEGAYLKKRKLGVGYKDEGEGIHPRERL